MARVRAPFELRVQATRRPVPWIERDAEGAGTGSPQPLTWRAGIPPRDESAMQRFTISLDDALAQQFDAFIAEQGYDNRSEAVRDLIRSRLGRASLGAADGPAQATGARKGRGEAPWCVANVSYVYDHHEQTVTARVLDLQHDHHDLVITSLHTHLDHDHCLETVVLRGPTPAVQACAQQLVALRGVRHGNIHLVPLGAAGRAHAHGGHAHTHFRPLN
ncbi:MAG: nickel-responsive transcriptional regulator NikR [Pseudomonadota bacterium]|nr:nickel-responsive transcriptional regulator NikR [Pseudomonadota bacterium]